MVGQPRRPTRSNSATPVVDSDPIHTESTPMQVKLGAAKTDARNRSRAGDYAGALACLDALLAGVPLDNELRLMIADVLVAAGRAPEAVSIYRALAMHDVHVGH